MKLLAKGYSSRKKIFVVVASVMLLFYLGARFLWGEHYLTFFKGIIKHPFQVGALSPCSTFVAAEITKYIAQHPPQAKEPIRILEVGAGSGVFTDKIAQILEHDNRFYQLDAIEIDPEYAQILRKRFAHNPSIAIQEKNILAWHPPYRYDYIVSSLPFNNMDQESIKQILQFYQQVLHKTGVLSYIENRWLPGIKELFLRGTNKEEYQKKRNFIANFKDRFGFDSVTVWGNIPPVYVHHLRIGERA